VAARLSRFTGWITQRPGNAAANHIADNLEVIDTADATGLKSRKSPTSGTCRAGPLGRGPMPSCDWKRSQRRCG